MRPGGSPVFRKHMKYVELRQDGENGPDLVSRPQTLTDEGRRSIYDGNRAQKEFAPRSSPPTQDAPRSSAPKDDAISQMGLLEFLFALLTGLLCLVFNWLWKPWYKSFRKRYDFQAYVEKAHANANVLDPGISLQDVLDFETSIDGKLFDMRDDHNDEARYLLTLLGWTLTQQLIRDSFGA
ncbi:hypothetical protein E4T56_gene16883 [Termitomyces sp. T112]|nr:hypothetical protein E4T56_gene16883 [Termitomyces sp. T112]